MTNEPPTDDGQELVDDDLPGSPRSWGRRGADEASSERTAPEPGDPEPPEPELGPIERVDQALENTEAALRAEERAEAEAIRRDREDYEQSEASEFDDDPSDSALDEMADYDLPRAMIPDDMGESEWSAEEEGAAGTNGDAPAESPTSIEGELRQNEWVDIPQSALEDSAADDATPHIPDPFFIDDEFGGTEAAEGANADPDAMRLDPGWLRPGKPQFQPDPLQDRSYLDRAFSLSGIKLLILGFIAAAGITVLSLTGGFFWSSSSDDSAVSLPAATIEATTAPSVLPTQESTVAATIPKPAEEIRLEQLALASADAFSDSAGDLWLQLQMEAPLDVDLDTLAFVYAFAIGAALQTDSGYNGALYSVTDGATYAESVFGSSDFPRTSNTFNANFQVAQAELWMTPEGRLAIHLIGDSSTGGLPASLFGPDTPFLAGVRVIEEEGGPFTDTFQEYALGTITQAGSLPLSDWIEVEPDQQPLQLNVPDTSNRN